jgi:hypothetical protein
LSDFLKIEKNSVWTISCSNHVYASSDNFYDVKEERVPGNTGVTIRQSVLKFIFENGNGTRVIDIDPVAWPANNLCAY